ncbi:MAG: sensor histidine kinase [Verrucomicrobiota bacterium]
MRISFPVLIGLLPGFLQAEERFQLTTLGDVRELTLEEAKAGPSFHAKVTVISHLLTGFDGQKDGIGLFFQTNGPPPQVGHEVVVHGNVTAGNYEPYIIADTIEVLGPLPHPPPLRWMPEHLLSGTGDNRWVETEGLLVHVQFSKGNHWGHCRLISGFTDIGVRFRNHHAPFPAKRLRALEGQWIRVQGSGAPLFNDRRQRIGSELICPGIEFVSLVTESPSPPSHFTPLQEIGSWNHRQDRTALVRTRGVLTWMNAARQTAVLENEYAASVVHLRSDSPTLPLGSVVDVQGTLDPHGFSVGLRYGLLSPSSNTIDLPPPAVPTELLTRENPFRRVQVQGIVAEPTPTSFLLQVQEDLIPVELPESATISPGTLVEVTGIKWAMTDQRGHLQSLSLRPSTLADVQILRSPPWWTPQRSVLIMSFLLLLIMAAILWGTLLNRRVRQQTNAIRTTIETNATLEERNRIARDLHDTLSQGFSGLAWQLASIRKHLGSDPAKAKEKLDLATRMVEHSLLEARHSLTDLRSPLLDSLPFAEALEKAARAICESADIPLEVRMESTPHFLSQELQTEVLRILLEAVSNATRHASPQTVFLACSADDQQFAAEVKDDGSGFSLQDAMESTTHFGLRGMHERARKLGATLHITSGNPGTTLVLTLPKNP